MKILTPIRTAILILLLFPLKLSAEEQADTVHTFRFVPGRDMFYIPYSGNEDKSRSVWTATAPPERARPTGLRWRKSAPTA